MIGYKNSGSTPSVDSLAKKDNGELTQYILVGLYYKFRIFAYGKTV